MGQYRYQYWHRDSKPSPIPPRVTRSWESGTGVRRKLSWFDLTVLQQGITTSDPFCKSVSFIFIYAYAFHDQRFKNNSKGWLPFPLSAPSLASSIPNPISGYLKHNQTFLTYLELILLRCLKLTLLRHRNPRLKSNYRKWNMFWTSDTTTFILPSVCLLYFLGNFLN